MPIRKTVKTKLDELMTAGATPEKMKTTEGIGVRSGRRLIVLVSPNGQKTAAGLYWEQESQQGLPEGGFLQQKAIREGNTETIRLRDGGRGVTRRWDPGTGEYKFTALGKKYYSTLRRNYVVSVPIVVHGKRKNGTTYKIKSHVPLEKLGLRPVEVPLHLNLQQRRAYVKNAVKSELDVSRPVFEISDESWVYDDEGSWAISEETVGVDPETGVPESHVIIDRRAGVMPLMPNTVLFPHAICEEAFVESADKLCAPRQIAAILKEDAGEIEHALRALSDELYGGEWQGTSARMIMEFCKRRGLGCVVVHNEEVIETIAGAPILAFTIHEDHMYFYKDAAVRKALSSRREPLLTRLKKAQKQSQTPCASEWEKWNWEVKSGHHWVFEDDIYDVRRWFLENGMSPKVLLKDEVHPRTLIYNIRKQEPCIVYALPECSGDLQMWLSRLGVDIPYRGEGLPSMSLKVLQTLVKRTRERVWLSGEEKAAILEEYGFCCATCGSQGELEFDHIARLSESYDEQCFQPLCVECHREKTNNEARMYDGDQLASHFELEVWRQYVESPRPPPLVARLRKCTDVSDLQVADVIRCRRSALLNNVHPLPIFCPLDDIQPRVRPELGDLNFVTKPACTKGFAKNLGYAGPGWQHRVQTEWLLHTGVITWDDVSHVLNATAQLPAGLLSGPLEQMEQAWMGDLTLAKLSVNSLIGLWAIDEATAIKVRTSRREDDAPANCLTSTFHYGEQCIFDFVTRTKLISNASCRPLHDLCMCTEAVRVGQMLLALRIANAIPYELRTDSVTFQPKKKRKVELNELTYRELDTLYTKAYPLARPPVQIAAICSDAKPFRQYKATEYDRLKGKDGLFCPSREWTLKLKDRTWAECDPAEGERRVLDKQSLLVLGIAGTGKTTLCQGIVERLQAAGEKVDIISKTHVASRRCGGCTADHWVRRHIINGASTCSVLWIDEISQIDIGLLLQICKLTYSENVRFILSGDFNQFSPIGNNFRGTFVAEDALKRSNLLHTMASGNLVTLTECRRSDTELFGFYASLIPGGSRFDAPMQSVVAEAQRTFNFQGFCRSNLVISHKKRIQLNARINKELAPPCAVELTVYGRVVRGNSAQTMLLWPGIQLLGAVPTERKGIRNGCLYTVQEVDEESVTLQDPSVTLTHDQAKAWLRLSYAQTYASVQGTEFDAQLRLHDVGHPFFTRKHLFVGLSRARAARDVSVVP